MMSALRTKADTDRRDGNVRFVQKRTSTGAAKQRPIQSAAEQRQRHGDVERPRGLEIENISALLSH